MHYITYCVYLKRRLPFLIEKDQLDTVMGVIEKYEVRNEPVERLQLQIYVTNSGKQDLSYPFLKEWRYIGNNNHCTARSLANFVHRFECDLPRDVDKKLVYGTPFFLS